VILNDNSLFFKGNIIINPEDEHLAKTIYVISKREEWLDLWELSIILLLFTAKCLPF
jgi:hypothetical protein